MQNSNSMNNRISFELSATNQFLADLLESALDDAVSSEPLEVNSVEIVMQRIGEAELKPENKSVHIYLPLKIQLKRPAGLFTVEGTGAINLHLVVDFNIDAKMRLSSKTELVSHDWLEKPVLEIGALNIPVETLVNMVLNHHESIITAKIDAALKKVSDLNSLLQQGLKVARKGIDSQDLKGNRLEFVLHELSLVEPKHEDYRVVVHGLLTPTIGINPSTALRQEDIAFKWINESVLQDDSTMQMDIELPYDLLKTELVSALQGMEVGGKPFDVRTIDIMGGERLMIQLEIDEPIKAQVFVQGKPIYNEIEGQLFIQDLDVKVNPANFIYKLTAPLVNRFIEGKMADFFPLEINNKLGKVVKDNIPEQIKIPKGTIGITHHSLSIDALRFDKDRIVGKASIHNLAVQVAHF